MKNIRDNNQGIIFVSSLAVMLILFGLGMTHMALLRSENQVADNEWYATRGLYYAEAGAEHALADVLNGGTGMGLSGDLDGDAATDYTADFDSGDNKITAQSYYASSSRYVEYELESTGFSNAIQVGNNISATIANSGTFNGDLAAVGTISLNPGITVNGTQTPGDTGLTIPTPVWADYANPANFPSYNHYTYANCSSLGSTPPDGIYYITGSCTISGMGDFHLNGSLIVAGVMTVSSISNSFTIIPFENHPAVVVGSNLTITSTWRPTFDGLVYAGGNVNFWSIQILGDVDGAVAAQNDFDMQWTNNLTINYDPSINPPYFSGGGGPPTVTAWKGHQ